MVRSHGGLWWPCPAFSDDRSMRQRRLRLVRGEMPSVCETKASIPLDAIRRPHNTPIWKPEASLKCRSCHKGRYAPPVHMIRLTEEGAAQ
jgi:hypothetical protein